MVAVEGREGAGEYYASYALENTKSSSYCRCKEYLAKTICCAILPQIAETHSPELSDHRNTDNLMADSIFWVPGARNHQKPSKINFARFLSSPSTPGPNLAPMDLCGIFGFSSPSTLGPYNRLLRRS